MSDRAVLVTGACGLVGRAVVARLAEAGLDVLATDLATPANQRVAAELVRSTGVRVTWADLTDPVAVDALVAGVRPASVVHLAAVIPPACYAGRALARRVNVDATASLVRAAEHLPAPPRFVLASSIAVYGARNPHHHDDLLSASTPTAPSDLYGGHKVAAERCVASSGLEWVVLRLGGVLSPEPQLGADQDLAVFGACLPTDGRLETVDVRDVAGAFLGAVGTDHTGEVFMIGGGPTHRVRQGDLADSISSAMGLGGSLLAGRRGDPDRDDGWFATDWMDTARAQEVLGFQHHTLPDLLEELRAAMGWRRRAMQVAAPVLRRLMRSKGPYEGAQGELADPWAVIAQRWGDPSPDAR
jgi:nucleoside-diphosphate-sugar epimerase